MDRWMTEQTTFGRAPSQRINVEIVQPPDRMADRLALGPGDLVVVRRRVRYLNTVQAADRWSGALFEIPARRLADLTDYVITYSEIPDQESSRPLNDVHELIHI